MYSIGAFPNMCLVLAKRHLKRPSFFLILGLSLMLQYLLGTFVFPDTQNTNIGVMSNNGGPVCASVIEELKAVPSGYTYIEYDNLDDMRADVGTGRLDCAFVFDGRMESVHVDSFENACTFISSTTSSKGFLIKEEVFSVILRVLSGSFLRDMAVNGNILKNPDGEAADAFGTTYSELADSDQVLQVFFVDASTGESVDVSSGHVSAGNTEKGNSASSRTAAAVILFAAALFFSAGRYREDSVHIGKALRLGAGRRFAFADAFMPLLILAVPLTVLCAFQGGFEGVHPLRIAALVLLVPATVLWAVIFAGLMRKESICLFASISVVMVSAVLIMAEASPLGFFTGQLGSIRFAFPPAWYQVLLTV